MYGQDAPTADEKIIGSQIANKLNELMRPRVSFSAMLSLSAGNIVPASQVGQTQYLDFQCLLDSSGSIGSSNFDNAKNALKVSEIPSSYHRRGNVMTLYSH